MTDSVCRIGPDSAGTTTNSPAINTFNIALAAAELTKQNAYATAFATFSAAGFTAATFPAYKTAILAADKAYMLAVDAAGAAGLVPAPGLPGLSQSAAGALGATTYFVKTTYTTSTGETLPSAENNFAASANNVLVVASPAAQPGQGISVTGWNVYISNTAGGGSGAETRQNGSTPIAIGTPFTEPTSGLVAGVPVPGAGTSTPNQPTQPVDDGSSFTALLPQNTALSIGLLY